MTKSARFGGVLILLLLCYVLWYAVASDYGDGVASGTYHLAQNGETSTLVLRRDHTFQQELSTHGKRQHAAGGWRRVGEGGVIFSNEFLPVFGQELSPDGTAFAEMHKDFGFLVSLAFSQHYVLWYGKASSSPDKSVPGTYTGDEEGTSATLVLKKDHTFEQTVRHQDIEKRVEGIWTFASNGDIVFSRAFLKANGEALVEGETASAFSPNGDVLQIVIQKSSKSGGPIYRKTHLPWN